MPRWVRPIDRIAAGWFWVVLLASPIALVVGIVTGNGTTIALAVAWGIFAGLMVLLRLLSRQAEAKVME